ncbi:MAG: TIGR01777 family oxidoreductase [Bryobacterales bacterium]|nr:TIGR01777 family oxidoreductase [Bryobacterales bacterium]
MTQSSSPVVTGATGFVGRRLCKLLTSPRILTRAPEHVPPEFAQSACFRWDPARELPPAEAFDGCQAVFHLAGEPVAEGRWTKAKKANIRDSRVEGTKHLVEALRQLEHRPEVLVSASAVGIYGSRGDEVLAESATAAEGFLADVCRAWEAEALAAEDLGMRVVTIRIGLVLGAQGGALARMLPLFKLCAGGRLGHGRQWMPWIHVDDLAALFLYCAQSETLSGAVNGSAPDPVTNRHFTKALASAVGRPALFPAPAFALRVGLGEFSEVLLASQRAVPDKALSAGFEFEHPTIETALEGL